MSMNAKELIKLIESEGWIFSHQRGSHKIFKHPSKKGIVIIAGHGKKDFPPRAYNSILKNAGLK
jgi:predicted RNA binding protein YcfA (HicA-like mRNA interferase family)